MAQKAGPQFREAPAIHPGIWITSVLVCSFHAAMLLGAAETAWTGQATAAVLEAAPCTFPYSSCNRRTGRIDLSGSRASFRGVSPSVRRHRAPDILRARDRGAATLDRRRSVAYVVQKWQTVDSLLLESGIRHPDVQVIRPATHASCRRSQRLGAWSSTVLPSFHPQTLDKPTAPSDGTGESTVGATECECLTELADTQLARPRYDAIEAWTVHS